MIVCFFNKNSFHSFFSLLIANSAILFCLVRLWFIFFFFLFPCLIVLIESHEHNLQMDARRLLKRPEVIKVILNPKPKTSTIDGQIVGYDSFSRLFPSCSLCDRIPIAYRFEMERNKKEFHSDYLTSSDRRCRQFRFLMWSQSQFADVIDWTHNFIGSFFFLNRIECFKLFSF